MHILGNGPKMQYIRNISTLEFSFVHVQISVQCGRQNFIMPNFQTRKPTQIWQLKPWNSSIEDKKPTKDNNFSRQQRCRRPTIQLPLKTANFLSLIYSTRFVWIVTLLDLFTQKAKNRASYWNRVKQLQEYFAFYL